MEFTIKIDCDNAAFDQAPEAEVARILRDVAQRVVQGQTTVMLFDYNGNQVGEARFTFDGK